MHVESLWNYPVKGLQGMALGRVSLQKNGYFPHDRRWGIIHSQSQGFGKQWLGKSNFLMLAKDTYLYTYRPFWNPEKEALFIENGTGQLWSLDDEAFILSLKKVAPKDYRLPMKVVECAKGQGLTDQDTPLVSFINKATVKAIAGVAGVDVDWRRFRGNIYLEGVSEWQEQEWVGKTFQIGTVLFEGVKPIARCKATCVNPKTGTLDINIPLLLRKNFKHIDCGLYARIVKKGALTKGDAVIMHNV